MANPQTRAGIVPYYIDGSDVYVYLMIPSNAAYGGTSPQIAKGRVEDGEDVQETAIREGEEELGLVKTNINHLELAWSGTLGGMDEAGYRFAVYMAQVKDVKNFTKPHYETGWSGWLNEKEINKVRSNQRQIVSSIIQKAKLNHPQQESRRFANFFYLTEASLLNPETNKPYRYGDLLKYLEHIFKDQTGKGVDSNRLWLTYSDVPRLNVYPRIANKPGKTTPTGVFAYPLEHVVDKSGKMPSFTERNFIIVFKSKEPVWEIGGTEFGLRSNLYDISSNLNKVKAGEGQIADVDFPEKEKLIALSSEFDLNLIDAIQEAIDRNYSISTKNSFVYRVLEQLAKQLAKKDWQPNNWYIRWNKLLRKFGLSAVVDTQDTGAVHGAEPSQGVFVDTSKVEVIEIINNKSSVAQKLDVGYWPWGGDRHDQQFLKSQRVNKFSSQDDSTTPASNLDDDRKRQRAMANQVQDSMWRLTTDLQYSTRDPQDGSVILSSTQQSYLKKIALSLEAVLRDARKGMEIEYFVDSLDDHIKKSGFLEKIAQSGFKSPLMDRIMGNLEDLSQYLKSPAYA